MDKSIRSIFVFSMSDEVNILFYQSVIMLFSGSRCFSNYISRKLEFPYSEYLAKVHHVTRHM